MFVHSSSEGGQKTNKHGSGGGVNGTTEAISPSGLGSNPESELEDLFLVKLQYCCLISRLELYCIDC